MNWNFHLIAFSFLTFQQVTSQVAYLCSISYATTFRHYFHYEEDIWPGVSGGTIQHQTDKCWNLALALICSTRMNLEVKISSQIFIWVFQNFHDFFFKLGNLSLLLISMFSFHIKGISLSHMEKAMACHSSTLAWKIPWLEEPGGLKSTGSLKVGHD